MSHNELTTFERTESAVRSYSRSFPTVFQKAKGSYLYDRKGERYLDFFAGAGALNYGHNHPQLKDALIAYLSDDNITHSLDMATVAKEAFLQTFTDVILHPRDLPYRIQFTGPTGTNSVEAALKLARKVTGRSNILYFTNAFHGMTLGALAVTGNEMKRQGAGIDLNGGVCIPFDGYSDTITDSIAYIEQLLSDKSSGVDRPAAVIIETVQAEGGVNVAGYTWLAELEQLCRRHDMLFIVDDIQVGCGRTGPFFSFEPAGVMPDIVCLSKALSGYGLPLAVLLVKPEFDIWKPGEHNATFRGHNPAFVTARAAFDLFWANDTLSQSVTAKSALMQEFGRSLHETYPDMLPRSRGRGMIWGLEGGYVGMGNDLSHEAFSRGLIIETAGANDEVLKLLPPLTIDESDLLQGLEIIGEAVRVVAENQTKIRARSRAFLRRAFRGKESPGEEPPVHEKRRA